MQANSNGGPDSESEVLEAGEAGEAAPANDSAPRGKAPSEVGETLGSGPNLESILRIPVNLQVVLGSATMPVANLMKLGRGAIVPLDHRVGEPVDVVVNGRIIARGEVVVVEDDNSRFGISLTEIVGAPGTDTPH
jgi:flagellar motor switch protein FliN